MKKTLIFYKPEYADLAMKLCYWRLRGTRDALPKDYACEVTIPVNKEDPQGM